MHIITVQWLHIVDKSCSMETHCRQLLPNNFTLYTIRVWQPISYTVQICSSSKVWIRWTTPTKRDTALEGLDLIGVVGVSKRVTEPGF